MRHRRALLLIVAACVLVMVALLGAARVYAQSETEAPLTAGKHLVTLYDQGVEQSFVTGEKTIGEALAHAGVTVEPGDRVEPAVEDEIVAPEYTVNIYRARPVVVIDGAIRQRIVTAAQVPEQIAEAASLTLHPEDTTELRQSTDLVGDGAALQFVVDRATPFTLQLYGETIEARTQATTVRAMLEDKSITLASNDRASLPLDTPITTGMELRIWREGKQTQTVEEPVAFETEVVSDANRPANFREVQTPGEKGLRSVTYEIVIQDGREVARTEIASVTITPAKKQVEVHGTKPEYMPYTGGGTKSEWLAASTIPEADWGYADWLVQKESGWNPNARNRSSGACGLAQALPCSKVPGDPHNPVNSLNWMNGYVKGRYGTWANAVAHSKAKGWY